MRQAYIGVDVGTTSARAGVFDEVGALLGAHRHPLRLWHEPGDIVEQSSADIWSACAASVCGALREAAIAAHHVKGIGFDATCSLVVLDRAGQPLSVSSSGDAARNVVNWARRNYELNALTSRPVRWICEDAVKFVRRELRRGNCYDAIILDPPTFGHGPAGEVWKIDEHLPALLAAGGSAVIAKPVDFIKLSSAITRNYLRNLGRR